MSCRSLSIFVSRPRTGRRQERLQDVDRRGMVHGDRANLVWPPRFPLSQSWTAVSMAILSTIQFGN